MANKIIAFVGFSGTGKSTLASKVDPNAEHISFVQLMWELSRDRGSHTPVSYLAQHLLKGGLPEMSDYIFKEIMSKLERSDVVIDEIPDYKLFKRLEQEVGRSNITLISLNASFSERVRRVCRRGQGAFDAIGMDLAKLLFGTRRVMDAADASITTVSQDQALSDYKHEKGQLARA